MDVASRLDQDPHAVAWSVVQQERSLGDPVEAEDVVEEVACVRGSGGELFQIGGDLRLQVLYFGGEEGGLLDTYGGGTVGGAHVGQCADGGDVIFGWLVHHVAFVLVYACPERDVKVGGEEDGVSDGPLRYLLHWVIA